MDIRERILGDASKAYESELVSLAAGILEFSSEGNKVAAIIFYKVLDQKLLKDALDGCKPMIDDTPIEGAQRFTIFLAGNDGEHYGMFSRLWRAYVLDPEKCPKFTLPGGRNRFLSEAIRNDFGLPGKVYIDDILHFSSKGIAGMIASSLRLHVRKGAKVFLVGGDVLDLMEVIERLKENSAISEKCDIVPLLAKCQ